MQPGTDDESQMEAWLTEEGSQTRLVVEERGCRWHDVPARSRVAGTSGGPGRSLAGDTEAHSERWTEQTPAPAWRWRWDELSPAYVALEIE